VRMESPDDTAEGTPAPSRPNPRQSAQHIVAAVLRDLCPLITIDNQAVTRVAEMLANELGRGRSDQPKPWDYTASPELHPTPATVGLEQALDWIFLTDTINFSFWTDPSSEPAWEVTWQGRIHTGYFAACACVNRALAGGIPLTSPEYMAEVGRDELREVFRADNGRVIPMLDQRVGVINEAGRVLEERFTTFSSLLLSCNRSALRLVSLVTELFPSYRDYATFRGQPVSFLKRAQILAGDCHGYLVEYSRDREERLGFEDIDELTMFADYRVPQVMAHLGVLHYSHELTAEFAARGLWENGCEAEVVLRGFSIHGCELIAADAKRLLIADSGVEAGGRGVNAVDVDMFLWTLRRQKAKEIEAAGVPFHRVRCIYY